MSYLFDPDNWDITAEAVAEAAKRRLARSKIATIHP